MSSMYKGMRWLKCDLQMQTPADARHWTGERMVAGQEAQAAKAFAEACHQTGLDVVGITDHNFLSREFLPHLQAAFGELERDSQHKITLFPGFEFEAAGVGRGVHVLCMFEPGSDLALLDAILTECGVAYPRVSSSNGELAKSDKNLKDILRIVQKTHGGIVIMPHAMSNDGIFDNDSISEWLQKDQFTNPDLLALEVPKPVGKMSPAFQKLFRSGDDCLDDWKRIRPVATVMSSDNKTLIDIDDNAKPKPNSIGYRYSWIKMSEPSIESLRQAFLDHESRIALPENVTTDLHPEQRIKHSRVISIKIRNASFLEDQEILFSPNLNCVIGGRGSGKSTALEYLRIIFGKDDNKDIDQGTRDRIARIRGTLTRNSEIEVVWLSADGVQDSIVWRNGSKSVEGLDLPDPKTFFDNLSIQFFSQQQLNRLTESKVEEGGERQAEQLLDLIDGFAANELKKLGHEEIETRRQAGESFTNLRNAAVLESNLRRNQQEKQELDRQYNARQEIQDDLNRYQQFSNEIKYLDSLDGQPGKTTTDVQDLADQFLDNHPILTFNESPNKAWLEGHGNKVKAAKQNLASAVRTAIENYEQEILDIKATDGNWPQVEAMHNGAAEVFRETCEAKGLTPEDLGRIDEINTQRDEKQIEIDQLTGEIKELKDEAGDPEKLMTQLHDVWSQQFKKRQEAADRANELAILPDRQQRFIEVTAQAQRNKKSFKAIWNKFDTNDGRSKLGKRWEHLGELIYNEFCQKVDSVSPWQVVKDALDGDQRAAITKYTDVWLDFTDFINANPREWSEIRCSRVKDTVDFKLFRPDGTEAGSISAGTLSDGQRNTAALALLLAQEGGPLIIDQPEDELDSNFVFRELIPMLRKVKSNRQLIMTTHNANLPVNGDAELVYAFEAKHGRGEMLAEGGLDQGAVTKAVLDIMEGTEEAFRRRREKYHF